MENNRSIQQIAQNLGEYISSASTQIDDKGKLQYYLCGSLATMLLSNATSIENCDIGENSVMNIQEKKTISQEAREDLSLFARPIHDIDVINVSGNMVDNSKVNIDGRIKNRMLRVPVQRAIPDIEQLFKDQPSFWSAFSSIDSLEDERKIVKHRVARITIGENKEIYITAPEALIAHKLEETIQLCSQKNDLDKYEKDIKDLATMISGISKIYDKKDLEQGILDTIKEKDCSHFVEHKSELDDIFANITNDIENYISKNGLQDRLKFSDIREVLEGVYSIKKGQNLRGNGTETRLLASAIEAIEKATRISTVEINSHGFLRNPEEYIRMLRIQGKEEFANEKQREYEYFMNNREKMPELLQKGYDTRESDELAEALYNGEFVGESIDIDFSEFEKGKIEYKGIAISDDGLIYGVNEYGEITREAVSEEVISEIEESVKRGEISLNEEQRQTLLNAKQNIKQNEKIGQEEFKKVAESSIEEKEQTFRDLRMATQEREQEERNYNEQGE